jgi:hypothetical protein
MENHFKIYTSTVRRDVGIPPGLQEIILFVGLSSIKMFKKNIRSNARMSYLALFYSGGGILTE